MKIGFDAKRITRNGTGLGNYSRFVVDILSRYFPDNSYFLYSTQEARENLRKRLPQGQNVRYFFLFRKKISLFKKIKAAWWRSRGITDQLKKDGIEIYHGLSNELPAGLKKNGIRSVVTIHDLIFIKFPQYYKWLDRKIYRYKFRKACENSDRIIAVSECTKRDIVRYFHIPEEKIDVVYQGCDDSFRRKYKWGNNRMMDSFIPDPEEESGLSEVVRKKYDLPEKYILYVGSIEERKNMEVVVKAMPRISSEYKLVAVGRKTSYMEKVLETAERMGVSGRIVFIHNAEFKDLPQIYRMASVFIYPSLYEGFGIPVLEALCSGVPVIAARGSCLEEAGGPDSIYVDPHDAEKIYQALYAILNDSELAKSMIEKGIIYSDRFMPELLASDLQGVYQNVLSLRS